MSTAKLRCVVIDDSKMQRVVVAKMVEKHRNLKLIAEFENAIEAQKTLSENQIDLVFLDIEMPIINGFEFIESLKIRPLIILVTAKAEYAMQAFDYDVTDYLLKPITANRFNVAVRKALLYHSSVNSQNDRHIFVSSQLKKVRVSLNDIKWVEGLGDYLKIITEENAHLVLSTLKSFMAKLPNDQFLRIHKSYIVNLHKVERYNGSQVEVRGQKLPLSRHKKAALIEALQSDALS